MNKKEAKKIILVEDDPAILDIYSTMLKKDKFDVEIMTSGEDTIKYIKSVASGEKDMPDLVLLDLILPDINGIEVFKEIKNNEATKKITVFMLTNQQNSMVEWPDEQRPEQFLIKANTSPTQLIQIIEKELG